MNKLFEQIIDLEFEYWCPRNKPSLFWIWYWFWLPEKRGTLKLRQKGDLLLGHGTKLELECHQVILSNSKSIIAILWYFSFKNLFSPVSLRYNWQNHMHLKCKMWYFDIHILCEIITTIRLIITSLHLATYLCVYVYVVRTFKLYPQLISIYKSSINYCHWATYQTLRTYSSRTWRLLSFDQHLPISLAPGHGNHYSCSVSTSSTFSLCIFYI